MEREFRRYLECGTPAHGFAGAGGAEPRLDLLVACSCKDRGRCPSCNARRMAETVAHTVDHVFPPVPLRHRVLRWFARIDLLNADEALDAGAAQPSPPVATSGEDSAETLYRSPCR